MPNRAHHLPLLQEVKKLRKENQEYLNFFDDKVMLEMPFGHPSNLIKLKVLISKEDKIRIDTYVQLLGQGQQPQENKDNKEEDKKGELKQEEAIAVDPLPQEEIVDIKA